MRAGATRPELEAAEVKVRERRGEVRRDAEVGLVAGEIEVHERHRAQHVEEALRVGVAEIAESAVPPGA